MERLHKPQVPEETLDVTTLQWHDVLAGGILLVLCAGLATAAYYTGLHTQLHPVLPPLAASHPYEMHNETVCVHGLHNVHSEPFTSAMSMTPLVQNGTIAIIETVNVSTLRIGDVIIIDHAPLHIGHRIIQLGRDQEGWYALTQGDNNLRPDPFKVRASAVEGRIAVLVY